MKPGDFIDDIELTPEEETEVRLFDELIKLPRARRDRVLEAVRVYNLLESTSASEHHQQERLN